MVRMDTLLYYQPWGRVFSISPLRISLAVDLSEMPFNPYLLKNFIVSDLYIQSNLFTVSIKMVVLFSPLFCYFGELH